MSLLPLLLAGLAPVGGPLQVELVVDLQAGRQQVLHHHNPDVFGITYNTSKTLVGWSVFIPVPAPYLS